MINLSQVHFDWESIQTRLDRSQTQFRSNRSSHSSVHIHIHIHIQIAFNFDSDRFNLLVWMVLSQKRLFTHIHTSAELEPI